MVGIMLGYELWMWESHWFSHCIECSESWTELHT